MLNAGVDKKNLRLLSEEQLLTECGIINSIHRQRIFDAIRGESGFYDYLDNKPLDAFISYRRSTGSQLASLLKGIVHILRWRRCSLQLNYFCIFFSSSSVEKLYRLYRCRASGSGKIRQQSPELHQPSQIFPVGTYTKLAGSLPGRWRAQGLGPSRNRCRPRVELQNHPDNWQLSMAVAGRSPRRHAGCVLL